MGLSMTQGATSWVTTWWLPAFYGTWWFITTFRRSLHLSLFWTRPIPFYSYPRSILILSTHPYLGLPSGFFPSGFPTNNLYTFSPTPPCYMPPPISSQLNLFTGEEYTSSLFSAIFNDKYCTILPSSLNPRTPWSLGIADILPHCILTFISSIRRMQKIWSVVVLLRWNPH
jgi:hypothetical protein